MNDTDTAAPMSIVDLASSLYRAHRFRRSHASYRAYESVLRELTDGELAELHTRWLAA